MSWNSTAKLMKITTGMSPAPIYVNSWIGNETGRPLVRVNDTPRAASIMPSVAMNGGILQ